MGVCEPLPTPYCNIDRVQTVTALRVHEYSGYITSRRHCFILDLSNLWLLQFFCPSPDMRGGILAVNGVSISYPFFPKSCLSLYHISICRIITCTTSIQHCSPLHYALAYVVWTYLKFLSSSPSFCCSISLLVFLSPSTLPMSLHLSPSRSRLQSLLTIFNFCFSCQRKYTPIDQRTAVEKKTCKTRWLPPYFVTMPTSPFVILIPVHSLR